MRKYKHGAVSGQDRLLPEEEAFRLLLDKYFSADRATVLKYVEKSFHRTEIIRLDIVRRTRKRETGVKVVAPGSATTGDQQHLPFYEQNPGIDVYGDPSPILPALVVSSFNDVQGCASSHKRITGRKFHIFQERDIDLKIDFRT